MRRPKVLCRGLHNDYRAVSARVSFWGAAGQAVRDVIISQRVALSGSSSSMRRPPGLTSVPTGPLFFDPDQGADILIGRYRFGDQLIDVGQQGHPFSIALPSERFADWLHSFVWLPDLMGVPAGKTKAQELCRHWASAFEGKNEFVFAPARMARRLFFWGWVFDDISQGNGTVDAHYAGQMRALKARMAQVNPGLDRLYALCAMVIYGARISERADGWLGKGLDALDLELEQQILPDGGHVSRSPEAAARALLALHVTDNVLQARGLTGSKSLTRSIDRLGPTVATLRHADGGMALFHGGSEGNGARIDGLLKSVPGQSSPFAFGPHTNIHRMEAGGTTVFLDAGVPAPRPHDIEAHLAPLALEMSTREGRLIVNCGWHPGAAERWRRPMRSAAAHSTLVLEDRSPGEILEAGFKHRIFGPAVLSAPDTVQSRRKEQPTGIWLESSQDGYRAEYGLVHQRRLFMGEDGDDIRGEDSLMVPLGAAPRRRDQIPFTIRFHFHPDVRVSLAQDLSSALLVQKGRAGWRFRTDAGPLSVEPSVYLGSSAKPVRAQQLVVRGAAYGDSDGQGRDNCVRWSLRRLSGRPKPSRKGEQRTTAPNNNNQGDQGALS